MKQYFCINYFALLYHAEKQGFIDLLVEYLGPNLHQEETLHYYTILHYIIILHYSWVPRSATVRIEKRLKRLPLFSSEILNLFILILCIISISKLKRAVNNVEVGICNSNEGKSFERFYMYDSSVTGYFTILIE